MRDIPKKHEIYRHFKGTLYEIVAIAHHTETMEELVIYRNAGDKTQVYARPLQMFMEPVDKEKYPDSEAEYRFEKVDIKKPDEYLRTLDSVNAGAVSDFKKLVDIKTRERELKREMEKLTEQLGEQLPDEVPEGISADLIRFLDTDDFEEKLGILEDAKDRLDDNMLNAMAVSLDLAVDEGSKDHKLRDIKNYLFLQMKFDGKHLRERNK
ncbi:MAG: DUF1653 domain-containing protein [Lachnospiraceae bacterium]|nr:DUF1653 domain-containing protein [Lachnospiraceae bacterium]